ncbi:hypothetical protein [Streptomyces sp. NPDC014623]|uniref:hypothetical protein n=1 Tax=Streptomyces sp. NPDC014623 TaxID=3364875 RepID=UPI0036FB16D9
MGDQTPAPVPEGDSGLAVPVDVGDEVLQFLRRVLDRVPGLPERFARLLEVLRLGLLDQVDHRVELVVLEGRPPRPRGAGTPRVEQALIHETSDVRLAQLNLNAGLVLFLLFRRTQFRLLLVAHQLSPRSS